MITALALFILQLDGMQLPEMKCKCPMIKVHITKYNFYGVSSLLLASPHMETLNIDLEAKDDHFHCHNESSYSRKGDDIDLGSWISNFAFPCLRSVNIICYNGMCWKDCHDKLFELSEFLLKNAMVLEKFVIIAKTRKCPICSETFMSPYSSQLVDELLGCTSPSTSFMMIFRVSGYYLLNWDAPVQHIFREANTMVDSLSKYGCNHNVAMALLHFMSLPSFVYENYVNDTLM